MAEASEIFDYVNQGYDIAPAGTQEEGRAAAYLSRAFHNYGLETAEQSFSYGRYVSLTLPFLALIMGLVGLLTGLSGTVLPWVCLVLAIAAFVLYALELSGIAVISKLGPKASSQNIIARQPGGAIEPGKARPRPVVVIAHYDTPRADTFALPMFSLVRPYLRTIVNIAMVGVLAMALVQVLPLPVLIHSIAWAISILCGVVLLAWGVINYLNFFVSPNTLAANTTKSGVAAVLALLDRVRPIPGALDSTPVELVEASEKEQAPVRRGEEELRRMNVIPGAAAIEYTTGQEAPVQAASVQGAPVEAASVQGAPVEAAPAPCLDETIYMPAPVAAPAPAGVETPAPQPEPIVPMGAPIPTISSLPQVEASPVAATTTSTGQLGFATSQIPVQTAAPLPDPARDAVVNAPTWGTSEFTPVNAGRRVLSDIPDPSVAAVDPFSVSSIEAVGNYDPNDFSAMDFATGMHTALTPQMIQEAQRRDLAGFTSDITQAGRKGRGRKASKNARIGARAAQMQADMADQSFSDFLGVDPNYDARSAGQQMGSWDNFDDADTTGTWQGGAAPAAGRRRYNPASESARNERRMAMRMSDNLLANHEIYFVLTGADDANFAGTAAFDAGYAKGLEGAYYIYLECLGAGIHSLVLTEGSVRHQSADHGLVNLIGKVSEGLGRPVDLVGANGQESATSMLLGRGRRAVRFSGFVSGSPAFARWADDVNAAVDPMLIEDAVDILAESIKRV